MFHLKQHVHRQVGFLMLSAQAILRALRLAPLQALVFFLQTKDSVRRGDVQAAWEGSRKDRFPDGSYQRIIKLLANHTTGAAAACPFFLPPCSSR